MVTINIIIINSIKNNFECLLLLVISKTKHFYVTKLRKSERYFSDIVTF